MAEYENKNSCSNKYSDIPRPEYPRPQMVRKDWINLNGEWEFDFDHGKSGRDRRLYEAERLSGKITVPFCPESRLSGLEYKDFINAVWYRKEFEIPDSWQSNRVLIHFGAVDYETEVWVNGISAGTHRGGYTSFSFEITSMLKSGINTVTVCAGDDLRSGLQPRGKQSRKYFSYGCNYTRTTGIWQTVWLEAVPETYISAFKLVPDPENACIHINADIKGKVSGCRLKARAQYCGIQAGFMEKVFSSCSISLSFGLSIIELWEPGIPKLYDLSLSLYKDNECVDTIDSYFGLRSIHLGENAVLINGRPVFQRLALDQGFYPEGVITAPSDEALRRDIEIAMELGFNGARLHQKVFEPRFLYWADKLGYIVWGEHGSGGLNTSTQSALERFLPEWLEAVERDFNHPSIIVWCPMNETGYFNNIRLQDDKEMFRIVYNVTKALDKTRPVIDASGYYHVVTDIFDIHDYEQDPEAFAARYEPLKTGGEAYNNFPSDQKYEGQLYCVSEYGGIWWNPDQAGMEGWGYGNRPESGEEFIKRYEALTLTLLDNPKICAFCYTQLYDVEQEVNGLYTYDRKSKFNPEIFRSINTHKAAIE